MSKQTICYKDSVVSSYYLNLLARTSYINALDYASPIGKDFIWFSRNDLLMSSLIGFIFKPLRHLGIMLLSISISFISRMPVNIIHHPGKVRIFNYRIFVKETNCKKLSLNLICIITLVMTVLWSYAIIVCLLIISFHFTTFETLCI